MGRNPITRHLINSTFVIVDLVNEDLVDLVHDGESLFRAYIFDQQGETHHIAEHDCNLLAFTLDLVPLREDFFG